VVDPEDLFLGERAVEDVVEVPGAGQVTAEGFSMTTRAGAAARPVLLRLSTTGPNSDGGMAR